MIGSRRTRQEEEAFLSTLKTYQEDQKRKRSRKDPDRRQSICLMFRGAVFLGLLVIFDIGLRKYRYTGDIKETVYLVLFLMSAVGTLQLPLGLYFLIKGLWGGPPPRRYKMRADDLDMEEIVDQESDKKDSERAK